MSVYVEDQLQVQPIPSTSKMAIDANAKACSKYLTGLAAVKVESEADDSIWTQKMEPKNDPTTTSACNPVNGGDFQIRLGSSRRRLRGSRAFNRYDSDYLEHLLNPFHPRLHSHHRRLMYLKRGMPGPFEIEEKRRRLDDSPQEPEEEMPLLLDLDNMRIADTEMQVEPNPENKN